MLRLCFLKLKFKLHWAWSWRLPTPQVQAASVRKASRVLFWVPYDPKQLLSRAGPLELQNGPQTHRTRWKLVSNKHKQTTLAPRDCLAFTCKTHPVGWQTFLNLLFSLFWRIFLKFLTLECLHLHSSTDGVGTLGLSGMCWRDRLRQRRAWGGCSSVTGRCRWLCAELATRHLSPPAAEPKRSANLPPSFCFPR